MRSAMLLLGILALIVSGITGVVLGLRITSLLVTGPCITTSRGVTCGRIASTIPLRRSITLLLLSSGRLLPVLGTTPRRDIGTTCRDIVTNSRAAPRLPDFSPTTGSFTQLGHQACVFGVEATSSHLLRRWRRCIGTFVHRTIPRHVTSATTNMADDVSSEVALLGTIIFAMANTTTVLTNLVFVVT